MRIRRLDIDNFRGVKRLSWVLPQQRFLALVGPGDATKSTILTAIERSLSERWNITFIDTDFYSGDVSQAISIRVAVSDLPQDLLAIDELGGHLCGIRADGELVHDPDDDSDECVVVELRVGADLEPQWMFWRPGDDEQHPIKASARAKFAVYRVDERVDSHLRWSRTSALGKLTEARHGTKQVLTDAARAAKVAVAGNLNPDLIELAGEIETALSQLGSAKFEDLKPGLDLSLTNSQGNLALYDGPIPLMNFGLGTRRLAGAATQQLAHAGSALLLVDEVEYGLEPHRLVHLLSRLRDAKAYAQVFVTTHSPTALQHLDAAEFVTVRSSSGVTSVQSLGSPAALQPLVRRWPEAFLSRRVVLTEGKTEYGMALTCLDQWDAPGVMPIPSSALGVIAVEGGGSQNPEVALSLLAAGYEVTWFMDSDDPDALAKVPAVEAAGGVVIRWRNGLNTETAVCDELDQAGLNALLALAAKVSDDPDGAPNAMSSQLVGQGVPAGVDHSDVTTWVTGTYTLENARMAVALAAAKGKWFKRVDRGRELGKFVCDQPPGTTGHVREVLEDLKMAIYQPRPQPETPAQESKTEEDTGTSEDAADSDNGSSGASQ